MVVFEDGLPRKSEYRRFVIRGVDGQNDVASMHEVITRRFRRLLDERMDTPDLSGGEVDPEERGPMLVDPETGRPRKFAYTPGLVVVDGGPPQVAAAQRALDELGIDDIPLCGLAKRLEEVWVPGEADPVILPRSSEGLYLLQRIRDEAHRFAITHHRSRRSKTMVESLLDDVPGLGEVRRKTLIKHFGSLKKLRAATIDEIAQVPGIGTRTATAIAEAVATSPRPTSVNTATGEITGALMAGTLRRGLEEHQGELVIVTGMTGAGRSTAAKELEDLGYFVVDNLPPELVGDVVRLVDEKQGPDQPVAAVVDVRAGVFFDSLRAQLAAKFPTRRTTLLFLEASDDILVRRQEAARRPHPLQGSGRLLEGIKQERAVMASLRGDADLVIDTTALNVHQLTDKVATAFGTPETVKLRITVVSFGFKYGVPVDADLMADMRFLPNPHWVPELRHRTGQDADVAAYVKDRQRRPGVPGALRARDRDGRGRLPPRGQAVHDRRDRLHRRQAPQRGDVGGDRRPAARRRAGRRGHPPRPRQGVAGVRWSTEPSVVALGGGHGLAASLTALRSVTTDLTAVVTVADNGGSSGRLRHEFGVLPPGDLRMALAALCGDDRWGQTWARVLQHRFESEGEMDGHSMGNLLIVTLWDLLQDHVDGLEWVGRAARGARAGCCRWPSRPSTSPPRSGEPGPTPTRSRTVRGQVEVATTPGEVLSVALDPPDDQGLPAGRRGHRGGRLGRPRPGILVHQRHPAPAGPRPARRPVPHRRPRWSSR